jgi:hypothetical protein
MTITKGGIGVTDLLIKLRALPLMWSAALRALVCLVPMSATWTLTDGRVFHRTPHPLPPA